MIVQRKIKALLIENGLDQSFLSDLLGISRESINRKLNGRVNFTLTEAITIAYYFGKHVEDIFLIEKFISCEQNIPMEKVL